MSMFDDLVPGGAKATGAATPQPSSGSGLFDDLTERAPTRITVTPKRPDIGRTRAIAEGVRSGLTFGFPDELAGAQAASGIPMALPGPLAPLGPALGLGRYLGEQLAGKPGAGTQAYEGARDEVRQAQKDSSEQYPWSNLGGKVAGAVAVPAGGFLKAGGSVLSQIPRSATLGSIIGGLTGVGEGETTEERAAKGASGSITGGLAGVAAPVVMKGAELLASNIGGMFQPLAATVRGLRNPDKEAAYRTAKTIQRDVKAGDVGLTEAEYNAARMSGVPVVNADRGGAATRSLARSAANTSPEARGAREAVTKERFESQGPRAVDYVTSLVRSPANATLTRDELGEVARKTRKPYYDLAYRDGGSGVLDQELLELAQAPAIQAAVKAAVKQAENRSASGRAGAMVANGKPTLEFWDLVQRQLRQGVDVAKRQGASEDVMELSGLRTALLNKLDTAVPSFPVARGVSAQFKLGEDAIDAGEKFISSGRIAETAKALSKMPAAERELFAEGFVSAFVDRVNKLGDKRNILNSILHSNDSKQRFELVLGPQKFKEMEARMRVESVMDQLRQALGNSTTVRQWIESGMAGGATFLETGDPTQAATAAGMWMALRTGGRAINQRVDQRVVQKVAEKLTSSDPKVLDEGLKMVAKNPVMLRLLRAADDAAARVAGQTSPKTIPGLQAPIAGRAEDEKPKVPRPPGQ
jgi:hypothetical protein